MEVTEIFPTVPLHVSGFYKCSVGAGVCTTMVRADPVLAHRASSIRGGFPSSRSEDDYDENREQETHIVGKHDTLPFAIFH